MRALRPAVSVRACSARKRRRLPRSAYCRRSPATSGGHEMRYLVIALLSIVIGVLLARSWYAKPSAPDPIQVMVTQMRTHAVIEHERQVAIWYRACPEVPGVNPQIFIAWPARLSYQLELSDVKLERSGTKVIVHTRGI